MVEAWSGTTQAVDVSQLLDPSTNVPYRQECPGPSTLHFFPWLPFGLDPTNNDWPDLQGYNNAYFCSPPNPQFWGWSKTFSLFNQVFSAAQSNGLTIREFDLQNELNIGAFTVSARLLYDNVTATPVLSTLRQNLASHGFSGGGAATVSVTSASPDPSSGLGYDCGSVYGDSAMFINLSEFLSAVYGNRFGSVPFVAWNGTMPCVDVAAQTQACGTPQSNPNWTQCVTTGMIALPSSQLLPSVLDVHSTPSCILSGSACDRSNANAATSQANTFFNDFWSLLNYRALTSVVPMFGELPNAQPSPCDGQYLVDAEWAVSGYLQSGLYTNKGSDTVLRPWENSVSSCYQIPANIGAPSGPYAR
jgi:hypothetical protein